MAHPRGIARLHCVDCVATGAPAAAPAVAGGHDLVCVYPSDLDLVPESQYLMRVGLRQRAPWTTKNLAEIRQLVRSRNCVGVLPRSMCADLLGDDAFRVTRLPQPRSVRLLVQSHLRHDAVTRAVVDRIRDCFGTLE